MAEDNKFLLLICNDKVGSSMAGPGIRYFELAKALSRFIKVRLLVPDGTDIESKDFEINSYKSSRSSSSIARSLQDVSCVIAQSLRPPLLWKIKKRGIKFIADLYDPLTIETLEYTKYDNAKVKQAVFDFNYYSLQLQLSYADHILCASERQRDLYLGMLSNLRRINPDLYSQSPDLAELISLAPFGLDDKEIKRPGGDFLYQKFPGIKPTDKIIYWGGGVWNWFDPITVLKAIEELSRERNDVKLIFVGLRHPNPKIKEMEKAEEALSYAKEHGLLDKYVFFNFGWTPYEERVHYLANADVGISAHFNNLETRFSFRTRILDYLWAELPVVTTEGDSFADLVTKRNLGIVVPYQDSEAIKNAITLILDDKKSSDLIKENIKKIKPDFYWSKIAGNIFDVISKSKIASAKISPAAFFSITWKYYLAGLRKKITK